MRVGKVDWKLSSKVPTTGDVQQGELANCPIAAILAALAHTASGRKHLNGMVTEYIGASVKTTLSDPIIVTLSSQTAGDADYRSQDKEIVSNRYFSVKLGKILFDVSDTFYVEYSDSGGDTDLVYMDSPNQMLWPCVIEKACAFLFGSYEELDDDQKHTINEFWGVLLGSKPQVITVTDKTDLEKIAKVAPQVPTIGASREEEKDVKVVTAYDGYAVLGIQDSKIELYDPIPPRKFKIPIEDFRSDFQAVFYGNP